ncbi:hypothetical protein IAQ61_005500 [Plenodomus lingam]|uniref:uncharacterized protein n=1 Tax=Leptosphaeria maculans TaxID=5022 RepID=UPI003331C74C|nr:hypothetical protein IAQ61_005500 [Plenodomus lingam]
MLSLSCKGAVQHAIPSNVTSSHFSLSAVPLVIEPNLAQRNNLHAWRQRSRLRGNHEFRQQIRCEEDFCGCTSSRPSSKEQGVRVV